MVALEWAHKKLRGGRNNLWFSTAKGGPRHLDRVGTPSSSEFTTIYFEEVKRYVVFDTEFCILFTIGELIIQQGLKGVPIWRVPLGPTSRNLGDVALVNFPIRGQ